MSTTTNFKDVIDLPVWSPIASAIGTNAVGMSLTYDMRNTEDRHPLAYYLTSNSSFVGYNVKNNEWLSLASPGLAGTFGAGATAIFHPSQGPRGTLATGWTTTQGALTTALPAAVGVNQLANRGDGVGFKIRIIGNHTAGAGLINERYIVANTGGTTPTITLDSALTFTPASGDGYEILSGRVFLLGSGLVAAGVWKYYDICCNSFSGNLATTNLPATLSTDSNAIAMSELHVPYTRAPGEGFLVGAGTYAGGTLGCLTATAATSTTITGQSAAGDATVALNEYRNFQIRIVEDTTNPTAVGQRRNITSHTAGTSPVYTVATWTVTPAATAKFVIENNDDRILLRTTASTNMYNYGISGNAWDAATTWVAGGSAASTGVKMEQAFGIVPDANKNVKPGMIYVLRGGGTTTIDIFDITAAATGAWTASIVYGNSSSVFQGGTSAAYDPVTNKGRYLYLNQNGTQRNFRFDMLNRVLEPFAFFDYSQGTALVTQNSFCSWFIDGSTKISCWYLIRQSDVYGWRVLISR